MGKWSNREIARRCSVSEHFVRDIKRIWTLILRPRRSIRTQNWRNHDDEHREHWRCGAGVQPSSRTGDPKCSRSSRLCARSPPRKALVASDLRLIARALRERLAGRTQGSAGQHAVSGHHAGVQQRGGNRWRSDRLHRLQRQTPTSTTARAVPPPPLRADDLVEELRPHTESATVAAIELAAHGA